MTRFRSVVALLTAALLCLSLLSAAAAADPIAFPLKITEQAPVYDYVDGRLREDPDTGDLFRYYDPAVYFPDSTGISLKLPDGLFSGTVGEFRERYGEGAISVQDRQSAASPWRIGPNPVEILALGVPYKSTITLSENPYESISYREASPLTLTLERRDGGRETLRVSYFYTDHETRLRAAGRDLPCEFLTRDGKTCLSVGEARSATLPESSWLRAVKQGDRLAAFLAAKAAGDAPAYARDLNAGNTDAILRFLYDAGDFAVLGDLTDRAEAGPDGTVRLTLTAKEIQVALNAAFEDRHAFTPALSTAYDAEAGALTLTPRALPDKTDLPVTWTEADGVWFAALSGAPALAVNGRGQLVNLGDADYIPHVHKWGGWTVQNAPTCTQNGTETRLCPLCGATETRTAEKLGHDFGAWTVTVPAACTENGTETRVCARCGKTETRAIPATGHAFGGWTPADDNNHVRVCQNDPAHTEAAPHTFDGGVITTAPTATAPGERTFTCEACGYKKTESVPPTGEPDDPTDPADPDDPVGPGPVRLKLGDIDNDGSVTAADARLALRAAVGLDELEPGSIPFRMADVDLSDRVTAADARLILRKAVGFTDEAFGKRQ